MPPALRIGWEIGRATVSEWLDDKTSRLGAALAFYTVLSLAPLLVILVGIVGIVLGSQAVTDVQRQLESLVGPQAGRAISEVVTHGKGPTGGWIATIVGMGALLLGASGVFGQLQDALNTIWEVEPRPGRGIFGVVRDRFVSFTMVLGTGFLLLVSLVISAALAAVGAYAQSLLPGGELLWQAVNAAFSLVLVSILFALIYKVVPDAEIAWRDAIVGGVLTAVLFTVGKFGIGLYLGRGTIGSAYGAAGALLVLLVWIYYSAQILFLGAEFTQVYANRRGSRVRPAPNARSTQPRGPEAAGVSRPPGRETQGRPGSREATPRGGFA